MNSLSCSNFAARLASVVSVKYGSTGSCIKYILSVENVKCILSMLSLKEVYFKLDCVIYST